MSGTGAPWKGLTIGDHFIGPLVMLSHSYLRDATQLVSSIDLGELQSWVLLYTMDISSLYTNILHEEGITSIKKHWPYIDLLLTFHKALT